MQISKRMLKRIALCGTCFIQLYGCGLRCHEVRSLLIKDVDFDRNMIHIRQGKGKKDRYVPLGDHLARGLKKYLDAEKPVKTLVVIDIVPSASRYNGSGGYKPEKRSCFQQLIFMWSSPYLKYSISFACINLP
jgi:integrase